MNKAAGKTHTISIPAGKPSAYDKVEILVRSCKIADPYQPENSFAFAQISKSGETIFSGWMNANDPGQNPLQDADYDVWLLRCE
jgi:hypothetical protein